MTPYELGLHAEVFGDRMKQDREEKVTLVWLGEHFHRIDKLPPLKEVLGQETKSTAMTDDAMLETAKQLNALFGGSVVERKESE